MNDLHDDMDYYSHLLTSDLVRFIAASDALNSEISRREIRYAGMLLDIAKAKFHLRLIL